jgi:hypothetical protein
LSIRECKLLDTDGTVVAASRPQPIVTWGSVSRRLLEECQHLLALLGVQSALRLHERGGVRMVVGRECRTRDQWTLTACGRVNVGRLAGLLNAAHPRKAERLAAWGVAEGRDNGARSDTRWTRVISVENAGEQVTYSVTIAGTHTYVTAGLVTHDTMKRNAAQVAAVDGVPPPRAGASSAAGRPRLSDHPGG